MVGSKAIDDVPTPVFLLPFQVLQANPDVLQSTIEVHDECPRSQRSDH